MKKFWKKDIDKTEGQPQDTAAEAPPTKVAATAAASAPAATEAGSGVKEENKHFTMEQNINIHQVITRVLKKKILFCAVSLLTIIIVSAIVFPIPRYYKCKVSLAPETNSSDMGSTVGSIASSLGLNFGEGNSSDAISPLLYPTLISSNDFVYSLLNIMVTTKDGKIKTSYYDYLNKHQKVTPYTVPFGKLLSYFSSDKKEKESDSINPFMLSKEQTAIFQKIKSNIDCTYDLKTGMIGVEVEDQDPLVAALMADSVCQKLQDYITKYRTHKARIDYQYYEKLTKEAKQAYEKARNQYSSFSDENMDVILHSVKTKQDDLENDMQLKYNSYSQLNTQLQAVKAKVQECTPVFTTVQSPSVPNRPAGPKRLAIILSVLFVVNVLTFLYVIRDLIFSHS